MGKGSFLECWFSSLFLNGILGLDFDWFKSARRDILITRNASVPTYFGLSLPSENLGKVDNTGFEAVAFIETIRVIGVGMLLPMLPMQRIR